MEYIMEKFEKVEKSIITNFRKDIWAKFVKAIIEYKMIDDGDKIAICMSGGKDSALLAKCFQELKKHGKDNFEVEFLCMNPGYSEENKNKILENAKILNIPIHMFETDIYDRVYKITNRPCYLCARMRRGYLYENAKKMGCNKIALGHHFDDVIETVLMGMLYGGQYQTMMPKLKSTSHPGMELIRPLYFIREKDVISWAKKNELKFIKCACRFTEKCAVEESAKVNDSKRQATKILLDKLRKEDSSIDMNIFRSTENVNVDTVLGYKKKGNKHYFLEDY